MDRGIIPTTYKDRRLLLTEGRERLFGERWQFPRAFRIRWESLRAMEGSQPGGSFLPALAVHLLLREVLHYNAFSVELHTGQAHCTPYDAYPCSLINLKNLGTVP